MKKIGEHSVFLLQNILIYKNAYALNSRIVRKLEAWYEWCNIYTDHDKNTAFHLSLRVTYNDFQCCAFSCMSALL